MSERVSILLGPPGTGKTTRCIRLVEEALERGVEPEKIAYLTFTRKAAREAIDRASQKFNLSYSNFPYFRTIHSLAYHMLGLSRSDVLSNKALEELGEELGVVFKGVHNEFTERYEYSKGSGDRCMTIYSLTRARRSDYYTEWKNCNFKDLEFVEVENFVRGLHRYKNRTAMLDFPDFIDNAMGKRLNVEVAIIDEAQDLTRQQWEFCRSILRNVPRIIIAGDDDQAIFEWAGADTPTFLSLKGERTVLPISYRLPITVFNLADQVVNRIKNRYPKQWKPRDEQGSVKYWGSNPAEGIETSSGSWLMLARHFYQLKDYEKLCRENGVVYKYDNEWSNQTDHVKAVLYYERLRRGESLDRRAATLVSKYVEGTSVLENKREYLWSDFDFPFEGRPDWMNALNRLPEEEREYIRTLRRKNISLTAPGNTVISTIHGSKGGEADNVLLRTDYNKKVQDVLESTESDAEFRVWYVGATRAKQALHIYGEKDFVV